MQKMGLCEEYQTLYQVFLTKTGLYKYKGGKSQSMTVKPVFLKKKKTRLLQRIGRLNTDIQVDLPTEVF